MTLTEQLVDEDVAVTRHERDDHVEVSADFGPGTSPSVDVVGETVIVVDGNEQYELTVDGDAQAFMKNGVVTIEVEG